MVVLRHLYTYTQDTYTQATCAPHSHRCPLRATGTTLESPLFEQRHISSRPRRSRATRPSRHRRPLPLTHLSSSTHRASAPRSFRPADSAANKASARPRRRSTKPRHNTGQRRYRQALRADGLTQRARVRTSPRLPPRPRPALWPEWHRRARGARLHDLPRRDRRIQQPRDTLRGGAFMLE